MEKIGIGKSGGSREDLLFTCAVTNIWGGPRSVAGLPRNPLPEFNVPGGTAIFHNGLDHKRHAVPFLIAPLHPSGLALAIEQDEIVFGDRRRHHDISFPGRGNESTECYPVPFSR